MNIIGKIMGIVKKSNAQVYEHNGLTPGFKPEPIKLKILAIILSSIS